MKIYNLFNNKIIVYSFKRIIIFLYYFYLQALQNILQDILQNILFQLASKQPKNLIIHLIFINVFNLIILINIMNIKFFIIHSHHNLF